MSSLQASPPIMASEARSEEPFPRLSQLTSPFERGSRVASRDSPKWRAYLQANEWGPG